MSGWPVMNLRRRSYTTNQVYNVDRWCLICGHDVRHVFKAPTDNTSSLEWELIISVKESKWNEDSDPRLDISLKPRWKSGSSKKQLFAEVKFTVDEYKKSDTESKRYSVLKFNMGRVEEQGFVEVLRSSGDGMGMPIKSNLTKVMITVHLTYVDGPLEVITLTEPKANPGNLSQKLEALLDSERLSDVVFEVGGQKIKAHRSVIGAMSETFCAMFEHDLSEKQTGRVVITDCEPIVFKALLRFMYTGTEPSWPATPAESNEFTQQLLLMADKYSLKELRGLCLHRLLRSLSPDNAIQTFLTVEALNLKFGEDVLCAYMRDNSRLVLASDAWKDFLEKEPRKAAEMLVRVLSKSDAKQDAAKDAFALVNPFPPKRPSLPSSQEQATVRTRPGSRATENP